ncbi:MAG: hypothetical protein DSZ06_02250 [Sulfurospirillum sp.]|nr:MAG: hypothetical protein DSZ06_02250 [Sulfurospirillum sp.]
MGVVLDDRHKIIGKSNLESKEDISKKVSLVAKQTIFAMNKDKVIPTPENYKTYFESQMERRSSEDKSEIENLIVNEEITEVQHVATLEKDVQDAYLHIKNMAELIASSYNKLSRLYKLTKETSINPTSASLVKFQEHLESTLPILKKDLSRINGNYSQTANIIKDFSQKAIYDKKYGTHNKKYLLKVVESAINTNAQFDYPNTLIAVRIKPDIIDALHSSKDKELVRINLSKILYKRSRRSDVVAHYEDGIFMILLKHTDKKLAQITMKRIQDAVEDASFLVNGKEIDVKLDFGYAPIKKDDIKESVIMEALDSLG